MPDKRVAPSVARGLGGSAARQLGELLSGLRRVFGMPDYERYLQHLHACHPEAPVPTEKEFFAQYVAARYGDGPTRCC
jgi:uncharacterized short protein YbdD (DUF466 family)